MFTNFQRIQVRFLEKYQNLQRLDYILATTTSLFGFFCGSVAFTWSSRFFDWNGLLGFFILFFSECIGWFTTNPLKQKIKFEFSLYSCLIYVRRGILFALLADGFKVGS